jgi:Anti-sigma-K factor rskA/Putative zinc-finger
MTEPAMGHDEAAELVGALALDAVDGAELEALRAHVDACPRCRAELDAYREVAATLGNQQVEVPHHLWDRISSEVSHSWGGWEVAGDLPPALRARLDVERPTPVVAANTGDESADSREIAVGDAGTGAASKWRRRSRVALVAMAAALIAVVGLSIALASSGGGPSQQASSGAGQGLQAAAASVLANPDHQQATLRSPDGREVARVVTLDGHGYVLATAMAGLPKDETYQLWGLIRGRTISLGLLGPDPRTVGFSYGSSRPSEILVTVEPNGGVVSPDHSPVATGPLA